MQSVGVFLAVMGVGSLVLPLVGLQFRLMSVLDGAQPFAGIGIALVGGALIAAEFFMKKKAAS